MKKVFIGIVILIVGFSVYSLNSSLQKGALLPYARGSVDLVVGSVSAISAQTGDTEINVGDRVTFNATVHNRGTGRSRGFTTGFFIGNEKNPSLTTSTGPLDPNTVETENMGWIAGSEGTISIKACADTGSIISETSERNNCAVTSINIAPQLRPDLIVSGVTFWRLPLPGTRVEEFHVGEEGGIKFTARNQEAGIASGRIIARVTASDGTLIMEENIGEITPPDFSEGGSAFLEPFSTAGRYTYRICVDTGNTISESNEENNCSIAEVNVLPAVLLPDLVVVNSGRLFLTNNTDNEVRQIRIGEEADVRFSTRYVYNEQRSEEIPDNYMARVFSANDAWNFNLVQNMGSVGIRDGYLFIESQSDSEYNYLLHTFVNGIGTGMSLTDDNSGDGEEDGWAGVRLNRGTYAYRICVDPDNAIAESNEENNCGEVRTFEVIDQEQNGGSDVESTEITGESEQ